VLSTSSPIFQSIQESEDLFLRLFPHRYDYIWATYSEPSHTPNWQTQSRHPLSDRQIAQGSHLYGVRFGTKTQYAMLDIDAGSSYHPKRDPFAIARMISALEPLGLVSYLVCTSSYSGGLHIYLPFEEPQSSWQCAIAISVLLESAGFIVKLGQLEIFPNPKLYRNDGSFSLFNAHRLPLQIGSYLLNSDFQPIWSDRTTFVQHWNFARSRNTINSGAIKRVLKQFRRQQFRISGKADKYLNDLNAEIELGWTGHGQTNRLLGRIAMRSYVFHHVIAGGKPLSGQALIDEIVRVARSLPGYEEWCRHQHEIEHRAAEWARCVEASYYFHYGDANGKYKAQIKNHDRHISELPDWNQQQSESARSKIRNAIADLLNKESLPSKATERFKKLLQYHIGGGSLYRHKDLWHPQFLSLETEESSINQSEDCVETTSISPPSLLPGNGGNSSDEAPYAIAAPHGNVLDAISPVLPPRSIVAEAWHDVIQGAVQHADSAAMPTSHQVERMHSYLLSSDPILIAEAISWLQALQDYSASGRKMESTSSSIDSRSEEFCSSDSNHVTSSGSVPGN
jgi:hypothetical protein